MTAVAASPYCRICLLPERRPQLQSRVIRGTTNPVWDEDFAFDVAAAEIHTKTIEISLYDYDQYSRDECIGQVSILRGASLGHCFNNCCRKAIDDVLKLRQETGHEPIIL